MRLLFMATLGQTLHEVTLGLDLAAQLKDAGIDAHFVVDRYNKGQLDAAGHPYTLVDTSMGPGVREVVAGAVRRARPDAIVLSDYMAHWLTHVVNYRTDPWFVDDFGPPVIPIDSVNLENTGLELELLGRPTLVSDRILTAPAHLLPVPANRPDATGGRGLPYRAARTPAPPSEAARKELRRSLGVRDGERLLMLPTLPWQRIMQTQAGPLTRELAVRVPRLVGRYLRRLPSHTRFLAVGPYLEGFGLPEDRLRVEESYTAERYASLLGASDAVLALFLPSFALERAVLADVPGLFTVNTFDVDGEPGLRLLSDAFGGVSPAVRSWLAAFPGPVPPFHMWPLRWNAVVSRLLEANPLTTTALRAELLDEESVVAGLEAVLYDPGVRDRLAGARADYRDAITGLPETVEVFLTAARRCGVTV
ncbi:DUF6365 family protein [Streptomyces sp. NPDC101490]|uniref:DUF6365 family protein n=1 Tax=Streptomyces sp. NPDC101490 TaxID=3366143 RepID=UPI003828232E